MSVEEIKKAISELSKGERQELIRSLVPRSQERLDPSSNVSKRSGKEMNKKIRG